MPANGHFGIENALFVLISTVAAAWLLRDAWKAPMGRLHYAQGAWYWLQENAKLEGTCVLHFDLQSYMLVSFKALASNNKSSPITTQWFHLESKHGDAAADQHAWLALRRAIYASASPANAIVSASEMLAHEKRVA